MNALIAAKKEVFDDFCIPWDEEIERKFAATMAKYPNSNPEIVLDNIAHPYMEKAYANPYQTYAAWLKTKYNGAPVTKKRIVSILGRETFDDLLCLGYLNPVKYAKRYTVAERN